jgi:hypothetical protein
MAEHNDPTRTRLVQAVFTHIASYLEHLDQRAVQGLQLTSDQALRIAKMPARDFIKLGEFGEECVSTQIDSGALDDLFARIDKELARESLIERCILRDAPRAMMQEFFGLSRHRYTKLRAGFNLPKAAGRWAEATEAEARSIYDSWQALARSRSASTFLHIADALDLSLRTVWQQLGRDYR